MITSHISFKHKNLQGDVCCAPLLPFDESLESCALEQIIFHLSSDFQVSCALEIRNFLGMSSLILQKT